MLKEYIHAQFRMLEPFGEVGTKFSLQLLSRTQFAQIKNKQEIALKKISGGDKMEGYFFRILLLS